MALLEIVFAVGEAAGWILETGSWLSDKLAERRHRKVDAQVAKYSAVSGFHEPVHKQH